MAEEAQPPSKDQASALFHQVFFHIVESDALSSEQANQLKQQLKTNGAVEHSPPSSNGKISVEGLTHIVSATIDFESYEFAMERMIPVVKPSWVHGSVQKSKLANPMSHSPDTRLFFSGLVVCIADLPEGDKDAIIGGVLAMGGLYSGAVSRMVTHIVALSQDPQACRIALLKNLDCKIILPHWFDDCLRLGRRIDEGPYLLPNPEVLRVESGSQVKSIARPDLQGSLFALAKPLPSLSSSRGKPLDVFKGHSILLARDLAISNHLHETIENLIEDGGGKLVKEIDEADTLVCQYREGNEFRAAGSQSKTVGNLSWLYYLIRQNSWIDPMKRLLHYPLARHGLPGFKEYRISLSNYNGEARIYLENLAKAAGCEFTKTMKMDNTHLITAHMRSEKCEAAKEWNINMVNHLWLEESYAKWQIQSLANPRYVHFPPNTNLGEVVGQTPIDREALENHFFAHSSKDAWPSGYRQLQPAGKTHPSWSLNKKEAEMEIATPSKDGPVTHRSRVNQDQTPIVSFRDRNESLLTMAEATVTPAQSKMNANGKENVTPSTGSRSAKEKAAVRLHDMSSDIALYEKERKRVGGVVFGGKRVEEDLVLAKPPKRSASGDEDMTTSDVDERQAKRTKKTTTYPIIELLVTGYTKWSQDQKIFLKDKERLRHLGIALTDEYEFCKFLAAPKIMRTRKFICAMAIGPTLITTDFVEQCLAKNKLLDPQDFPLADEEGEQRYRMQLPKALQRARQNQQKLLEGQLIYATENVHGGFDTYKAIVEANGGKCALYKGRAGLNLSPKDDKNSSREAEFVYLLSGPTASEAKLWSKFCSMVQSAGKIARIVKTDWMVDLALSQEIRWDESYAIKKDDIRD